MGKNSEFRPKLTEIQTKKSLDQKEKFWLFWSKRNEINNYGPFVCVELDWKDFIKVERLDELTHSIKSPHFNEKPSQI